MIQETYNAFVVANNGKPVEVEDASNQDQCMDLAFAWVDALKYPRETIRHLYAYQVWTAPLDVTLQYFHYIPNTPNGIPKVGDLVVFGQGVGLAGHICIASGTGSVSSFVSFDQNWNGVKYARMVTHSYDNILGWLHPKADDGDTSALQQQVNDLKNQTSALQSKIDNAKAALG